MSEGPSSTSVMSTLGSERGEGQRAREDAALLLVRDAKVAKLRGST